jgi:quercetin dioxygenase-like cupin family protein
MAGIEDERYEPSPAEKATLRQLQRGVFAKNSISSGSVLAAPEIFYAIPASDGQLVANDLSKYTEYHALKNFLPGEPIFLTEISATDIRSLVHGIVRDVKALLKTSGAVVPTQLELEISHHYGIEKFREVGSAMITVINREYCKRLVLMLPHQRHPEHWHTLKDETFHLLHGEIELRLADEKRRYVKNDVVVIPRGTRHEFSTTAGAVIEEISSTHTKDDSAYTDLSIGNNELRKTFLTNWMD